jgi:H+/gluconate symporter-like permease
LIGGIWFSRFTKTIVVSPPTDLFQDRKFEKTELPGLGISILCAVTPIILMLLGALTDLVFGPPPAKAELTQMGIESIAGFYQHIIAENGFSGQSVHFIPGILTLFKFMSDANVALFMAVMLAIFTLGLRKGRNMDDVMNSSAKSVGAISMIVLIIAGGGAFSQVLKDSHVIEYIRSVSGSIQMNPLLMAFLIASVFRLAVGSATVSTLTTAPIMLPIAQQMGTSPELMVLATGAGSVMWSHFNDSGFWLFKEYFGLNIKQTFRTWTVMESTVGIVGIITVLIMSLFI